MNTASKAHKSKPCAFVMSLALWATPVAASGQAAQTPAPVMAADDAARADTCARLNRRFDAAFGRSAGKPPVARLRALHRAAARVDEDPAGLGDLSAPAPLTGNARLHLAFWPGYHPRGGRTGRASARYPARRKTGSARPS